jgi:hypothetical protein
MVPVTMTARITSTWRNVIMRKNSRYAERRGCCARMRALLPWMDMVPTASCEPGSILPRDYQNTSELIQFLPTVRNRINASCRSGL